MKRMQNKKLRTSKRKGDWKYVAEKVQGKFQFSTSFRVYTKEKENKYQTEVFILPST